MATDRANRDTGISKMEELVQTGDDDGPEEPNYPHSQSVDGHLHVICVRDGGPHFGVRGIFPPLWWTRAGSVRFATLCAQRSTTIHTFRYL